MTNMPFRHLEITAVFQHKWATYEPTHSSPPEKYTKKDSKGRESAQKKIMYPIDKISLSSPN
jgi:hypothetical protein